MNQSNTNMNNIKIDNNNINKIYDRNKNIQNNNDSAFENNNKNMNIHKNENISIENIVYNYKCSSCEVYPIICVMYYCDQCSLYLCEECENKENHNHALIKIKNLSQLTKI